MDLQQKMWHAALDGEENQVRRLIEEGANVNAATDLFKATALHRASLMGRPEAVDVLLKCRANVDQKDGDGLTALLMAVNKGNMVITERLIKEGADINATNRDGKAALHFAALQGNHVICKRLIEKGAKIELKDNDGNTPVELAKQKIQEKKEEGLLEHTESFYKTVHLIDTIIQDERKAQIFHTRILNQMHEMGMEKDEAERFQRYLEEGSEEFYELNLMLIGESGVGKTTIAKGLLGDLDDPEMPLERTNGIDIHLQRCQYNRVTRQIFPVERAENEDLFLGYRLGMVIYKSLGSSKNKYETEQSHVERTERTGDSNTQEQVLYCCNNRDLHSVEDKDKGDATKKRKRDQSPQSDFQNLAKKAKLASAEKRLVPVTVWDFGGQEVFYATHQTFLSSSCLYMLVFDLNVLDKHSQDTGFPKIVLVGTHADLFPMENKGIKLWEIVQKLEDFFRGSTQRSHLIIDIRYFINATDVNGVPFELLRQCIMETAESLPDWGKLIPRKWILLENEISDMKSSGRKIVSVEEIHNLCKNKGGFERQDIEDFLNFQNSLSKVLYFKERYLKEKVILDPKWVIDALSSFITDEHFVKQKESYEAKDWLTLKETGKISMRFIDNLWKETEFGTFRDHLIKVLCRLDLITQSKIKNMFYVPSMVQQKCPTVDYNEICQAVEVGLVSFRFSFRNKFLPPAVFYRMIGTFLYLFEEGSLSPPKLYSNCVMIEFAKSKWMVMSKKEHEIEFFAYHQDERGKVQNLESYQNTFTLAFDASIDIIKTYRTFHEFELKKGKIPFDVLCQGCRKNDSCFISKKDFSCLKTFRCPKHNEYIAGVETIEKNFHSLIEEEFTEKEIQWPAIEENYECLLDFIASKLEENDRVILAVNLGFGIRYVDKFRHEQLSSHEMSFSLLYEWKNRNESIQKIEHSLRQISRKDLLDLLSNFSFEEFNNEASRLNIPNPNNLVTDLDLAYVAKNVVNFKSLSRFLRIPEIELINIEHEHKQSSISIKALHSLYWWKEQYENHTRLQLCSGLMYVEKKGLIEELKREWACSEFTKVT
ncbi:uncharacterized protein LOC134241876 [Saccostrea cucullata]|uniref:uncharacterized protein LOC134241876 n=1 Tax=Saccostrea cuccullata TaxID=36930 RepID=UPI002ED4B81C